MHPYSFTVSLRIFHPFCDPLRFTDDLDIKPFRAWKAGDKRTTPKGTELDGRYHETYWCVHLTEVETNSEACYLEDFLSSTLEKLVPHATFFKQVLKEGGRVELFVGLYVSRNSGFELGQQVLHDLSNLGVSLSFDIYP